MKSLVLELQQMAGAAETSVVDLLRKALMVCAKLGLADFQIWVKEELEGYKPGAKLPDCRILRAELRLKNPYHGLIPFVIPQDLADLVCTVELREPVGSISATLDAEGPSGVFVVPLPQHQLAGLMKMQQEAEGFYMEPVRTIARGGLVRILDSVRNTILQWSLRLEQEGILGEGMTFSKDERQRAADSSVVNNFFGKEFKLGDTYNTNQAGAVGPNAHAHDFKQMWNESASKIDLPTLAGELHSLRQALRSRATEPVHDIALGEVAAAERAASKGNGPEMLAHLKAAGAWTFGVARDIGVALAAAAIQKAMGT